MATLHRLKVTLRSVKPPIWRRIEVASDVTLAELSDLLEAAMGWMGGHLHAFEADGLIYERPDPDDGLSRRAKDESEHRLGDVLTEVGAKMRWDYDFGDGWQHNVVVEAIETLDPSVEYPPVSPGAGRAHPKTAAARGASKNCSRRSPTRPTLATRSSPSGCRSTTTRDEFDPEGATDDMRSPRPFADDVW